MEKTRTTEEPAQADIQDLISVYSTDFSSADCLEVPLNAMHTAAASRETRLMNVRSVVTCLKSLNDMELTFCLEVVELVNLILVVGNTSN